MRIKLSWLLGSFAVGVALMWGPASAAGSGPGAADAPAGCAPGSVCECAVAGPATARCMQASIDACQGAGGHLRAEEVKTRGGALRMRCVVSRTSPPPVAQVPLAARQPDPPGMKPRCGTSRVCTCSGGVHSQDPYICMGNMTNLCLASGGIPNVDGVMPPSTQGGDMTIYMSCWPKP
jgi:hypothetical protein